MNTTKWTPTHMITWNGDTTQVMLADNVFYTRAEWEAAEAADWELDPNLGLTFQGAVPQGESSYAALDELNAKR